MKAKAKTTFEQKCEAVAAEVGVEVDFFEDDRPKDVNEDDGVLHIRNGRGKRACFDVSHGQSLEGAEQNANTRSVLEAMGLERWVREASAYVFVEEQDDDKYCPHCGRGG